MYLYNADDERIATFACFSAQGGSACSANPAVETWTLRGLGNEVLRVFTHPRGEDFVWERDYVYRGGQLLAAVQADSGGVEETYSFHLDHLGSPRQVTKGGVEVAEHSYYPFGQEATSSSADDFELKFTGHERDENGAGAKSELDYMHARHCSPVVGRFQSVDPVKGRAIAPQSWNRYGYAGNSPMLFVDPSGRQVSQHINLDQEAFDFLDSPETDRDMPSFLDPGVQAVGLVGTSLLTPGPDEILVVGMLKGLARGARAATAAGKAKKLKRLAEAREVPRAAAGAVDPNKLLHIFGQARHSLDDVVKAAGSREAAFDALQKGAQSAVDAGKLAGQFETVVNVGGVNVTVRGAVVDGIARIGTAFR